MIWYIQVQRKWITILLINYTLSWKNKRAAWVHDYAMISFAYCCYWFFFSTGYAVVDLHREKWSLQKPWDIWLTSAKQLSLFFKTQRDVNQMPYWCQNGVLLKHLNWCATPSSFISFAQWQYHSQWSTNWGVVFANWKLNPIPAGKDLKHSPPSNFCRPVKATYTKTII